MGEKKQLLVNMAAALVTFAVQVGINFVLTPYITSTLGAEAYGFVNLSNTLVNYISILTVAVTSMASRFISIAIFKDETSVARRFYSSTLVALLVCVAIVAVPALICIGAIDHLLNISANLVGDVKLLMVFVLANVSLSLMSSNLSIGFYVRNKLYISSMINACGYAIRALLMIVLFALLPTGVWIVGFSAFAATSFVQALYLRWKRKLLPELTFSREDVHFADALTVAKAGIWNSVSQLGATLSSGLDMIVCNLFLGGTAMGVLSISRVIKTAIDSIGSATMSVFQPTLTKYYAEGDIDGLVRYAKWCMKAFGLVIAMPVGGFIAFGVPFFNLWVPGQDASVLYPLSVMAIIGWAVLAPAAIIQNIFTVLNKVKTNSLFLCIGGFAIVGVECLALQFTDWGIYAIAATSCVESFVRNLLYTVPAGARYLDRPWWTFFPSVGQSLLCVGIMAVWGFAIEAACGISRTWLLLIAEGVACVLAGSVTCLFLLFGKDEREKFIGLLAKRVRRK